MKEKPHSLQIFLDFVGLSENEFNKIISEHIVSPHKFKKIKNLGNKLKDHNLWSKDGKMDKKESKKIIKFWKNQNEYRNQKSKSRYIKL